MTVTLIDTNVLNYAYDRSEPVKQWRALAMLDELARSGDGVLSAQVPSEFFVKVTGTIREPLTVVKATERLRHFARIWSVFPVTAPVVLEAIWATARLGRVRTVLREDFNAGAVLEGNRFVDPFAEGLGLEALG